MFTSRSKRDSCYIGKSDVPPHLGPGYYNTDTSTLRRSAYTGQAPFQTTAVNDNTFDQEVKRGAFVPAPGAYEAYNTPVYIRGAIQEHSAFASTVPRFRDVQNDVPGPSQYTNLQPDLSKAGHTDHVRRKKVQLQRSLKIKAEHRSNADASTVVQSIPYKAKLTEKPIARTGRDAWIVDTAMSMVENPGPGAYIEREEFVPAVPALPKKGRNASATLIPVGGASSSIAKPGFLPKMKKMRSFPYAGTNWVRAKGRAPLFDVDPNIRVGPGDYDTSIKNIVQSADLTKPSPAFASAVDRFSIKYDKDMIEIAPNTYKVEDVGSISKRQNELRQQAELRQEVKKSLQKAIKLSEKLHPSVSAVGDGSGGNKAMAEFLKGVKNAEKLPPFLSMEEKTRVANPPVGHYSIPPSKFDKIASQNNVTAFADNDISMLAVNRLALRQTFGVQKWPETASSIPEKVIVDGETEEIEERPPPYGIGNTDNLSAIRAGVSNAANVASFSKAVDRDKVSEVCKLGKDKEHLGPGAYNDTKSFSAISKKHDFSTTLSGPFASTVPRNTIHKDAEQRQRDEMLAAENQQRSAEINAEKRAMGGAETAVNYAKARYDGATDMEGRPKKMYNNSGTDRNTSEIIMAQYDMSVPGVAVYNTATERRQNAAKLYAHDRTKSSTTLPESLRPEIAGPSATKAARVLLEDRMWTAPGPGYYSSESTLVKRSFNVLAEDNM
ncbi:Hypothetical protein GSB_17484 [Giardia duodenalis]|uniref:Uncharacterized protein n=2 Tax=Giardia intestinalis TaxID=5741 RepID=C6M098_GIAIB|nr:Hypothetical protein GL50581_4486 [Giardia intestinalis ATCC 50581]ESU44667.1 Hypothetical protein GSB_17484 [Giardia intestinalis]